MTGHASNRPIVVGVDDSPGSQAALDWARADASPKTTLCLVHAYPDPADPPGHGFMPLTENFKGEAVEIVSRAEAELTRTGWPAANIDRRIVPGRPSDVLLDVAGDSAEMVVVGRRGAGGFKDLLLGSAAYDTAVHSTKPVVIVPESWTPAQGIGKPVVLGIDRTTGNDAITFAFDQAQRQASRLDIVHLCPYPVRPYLGGMAYWPDSEAWADDKDNHLVDERRWMAEQVAGWSSEFPDVDVTQEVSWGSPAGALLDRATNASLVVVGGHDHGMIVSAMIGSVARTLMHQCRCPLAVVHAARD